MGFFSSLATLFSGNSNSSPEEVSVEDSVEYKGFSIIPAPISEGGQYRVAATITKGEVASLQSHSFIRSDVLSIREDCIELTIRKSKISIDQSGDSLFN